MSRYYGPFMLDLITLWNAVLFENKWMSYTPLQREETGNEQKGSRQKQFICHGSTSPTSLKVENMLLLRKRRIWWRNQKEKKTVVKVVHNDASVRTHPLTEEKRKMEKHFDLSEACRCNYWELFTDPTRVWRELFGGLYLVGSLSNVVSINRRFIHPKEVQPKVPRKKVWFCRDELSPGGDWFD